MLPQSWGFRIFPAGHMSHWVRRGHSKTNKHFLPSDKNEVIYTYAGLVSPGQAPGLKGAHWVLPEMFYLSRMEKAVECDSSAAINGVTSSHVEIYLYDSKEDSSQHPKWHGDKRKAWSPDRRRLPASSCSRDPSTFLPLPSLVICLSSTPLPNKFQMLFLTLPQIDFYHLQKKNPNYYTFQKKVLFFSWVRIYSFFFKYHHAIYGKEGKPSGLVGECVMKIQKTHASKWKEYRGIVAYTPAKWNEREEDWFASSLTWKEKSTRTQ